MTPAEVVWHDSLPLTLNGKVDRGKLSAMIAATVPEPVDSGTGTPTTDLERELIGVWASVLRIPPDAIGHDSNFYDLGGDSLAAARVFTGIRKQFGVSITLDRLYEVRTVRAMAACIQAVPDRPERHPTAGAGAS
jgi:acyl carrier protein